MQVTKKYINHYGCEYMLTLFLTDEVKWIKLERDSFIQANWDEVFFKELKSFDEAIELYKVFNEILGK